MTLVIIIIENVSCGLKHLNRKYFNLNRFITIQQRIHFSTRTWFRRKRRWDIPIQSQPNQQIVSCLNTIPIPQKEKILRYKTFRTVQQICKRLNMASKKKMIHTIQSQPS